MLIIDKLIKVIMKINALLEIDIHGVSEKLPIKKCMWIGFLDFFVIGKSNKNEKPAITQ